MREFRPTRFEILPLVVKNLILINVLFFLAQSTVGESAFFSMRDFFGLHHVKSPLFKPWQLVTYLFMHSGGTHLLMNMLGLWFVGGPLEDLWGPRRFLTFYFICGIGAGLLQLASLWYDFHEVINDLAYLKEHLDLTSLRNFFSKYSDTIFIRGKAEEVVHMALNSPENPQI